MIRRVLATFACAAAMTFAQACGPDFYPDVFVRTARPDFPARYISGHLGILQTGFPSADLFVAFRYLNGGTLTPAEQKGWSATYPTSEQNYGDPSLRPRYVEATPDPSLLDWTVARSVFPNSPKDPVSPDFVEKVTTAQGFNYSGNFKNCAADAFRTATATLQSRSASWGKTSPALLNWLQGQDRVFRACSATVPTPEAAPIGSPVLLQQDRAYQIAAAHFYARDFDTAEQEFLAIADDKASAWSATAGYLAARVLIRDSFLRMKDAQAPADFEPTAMQAAGLQLRTFLATHPPQPWQQAAEAQLALVRIRLEPEARGRELAELVAGPLEDRNYGQDVKDLLWMMSYRLPGDLRAEAEVWGYAKAADGSMQMRRLSVAEAETSVVEKRQKAFQDAGVIRSFAPMLDWTITLRALAPERAEHALAQWKRTRTLPWLVAALMLAPDDASPDPDLLQAAADISPGSPAWETTTYHRARLLIAGGKLPAARSVIRSLQTALDDLPKKEQEPSTRNALRGLLMDAAEDHAGVVSHLSRDLLLGSSQTASSSMDCAEVMKHRRDRHRCLTPTRQEIDTDGARLLNEEAPLSTWIEASNSAAVPRPLREAIAMQGWTRATLLRDTRSASALRALLPGPIQKELGSPSVLAPWIVLARNPGLQPYVDRGVQRAYSYDFVESYRLNWCYNTAEYASASHAPAALTADEARLGKSQSTEIGRLRSVDVGEKITAAVRARPADPQAPEALYLVLRMIRYGCNPVNEPGEPIAISMFGGGLDLHTGQRLLELRRDAASLMRRYYPSSPWTRKAAPFVGEVHPSKAG